ncbi:hypothetical protein [Thioclava sp. IC9]|uniref:hypothetical protein n=1 Tax=Thioclava sp. IC9 TaxID=1973007 RepID=UPI000B541392|nr:hypothetical protein [Thioclava sp. IC9]OWX98466.1 hypothetical protein B6V76_18875 [Thioclava sp. IC9]
MPGPFVKLLGEHDEATKSWREEFCGGRLQKSGALEMALLPFEAQDDPPRLTLRRQLLCCSTNRPSLKGLEIARKQWLNALFLMRKDHGNAKRRGTGHLFPESVVAEI